MVTKHFFLFLAGGVLLASLLPLMFFQEPRDISFDDLRYESRLPIISSPSPMSSSPIMPFPTPLRRTLPVSVIPVINHEVPFTSQAPRGQWGDPIFQDGCEEAAALMAMAWAGRISIGSADQNTVAIRELAHYERVHYGEFRDGSANDTAQMIRDYFTHPQVVFRQDIMAHDIITALNEGHVVIVPVNGRLLGNPHYTLPGPERHMLVIRGWDSLRHEFITNDPGTRYGEAYRYTQVVLEAAIRDYGTGYHETLGTTAKNMIVVFRP